MRDRLIELHKKAHNEWLEKEYNHETDKSLAEYTADYLLANGVTMQEWISVKDRLSEENTEVLIYCKTNSRKKVFFVDKIRYFRGLPIWQVWSGKVTHWMPLPQPPKGE